MGGYRCIGHYGDYKPADLYAPTMKFTENVIGRQPVDLFCIVALALLTLLSWVPRWQGPIDLRWDGGAYFILGTSLAEGKGYRLLNEPGEILADQYPPMLPCLIAAHQAILKTNDPVLVGIWLRRTWIVISVAYIVFAFLLARLFVSTAYAFWLSLVCLMSYDMYYLATLCFAELPFALTTVLFAYLYLRKDGASWTRYLAPAFAIASYLLRSMGIALLGAWVADALLRKQFRRAAIRAAVSLMPILAWQTYVHSVEARPDYQHPYYAYQRAPSMFYNVSYAVNMQLKDPFRPDLGNASLGDLCYRFFDNVLALPSTLGQSVTAREGFYRGHVKAFNLAVGRAVLPHWPYKVLLNFLGLLVLLGVVCLMLRRQWLIGCTVLLTVAAVCTTPWPGQFARYLAPILPLLLLALLALLQAGAVYVRRILPAFRGTHDMKALRLSVLAVILCESAIALQSGNRNFLEPAVYQDATGKQHPYHLLHYSEAYPDVEGALRWLVPRAGSGAVIAVSMPQWVYLKSGLKTVLPPLTTDPVKAGQLIDSVPVSFVIVERLLMDDNFNEYFPRLVERSPDKWKLVYVSPDHQVQVYGRVGLARLSGGLQMN